MPGDADITANVEKQLDGPMPWIGMYVAAASLICTLAMGADTLRAFRSKKYWFPTKYFSLNATSLALLTVVMKLPVDLTTRMYTDMERLAKVSSMIFMSTAIGNFMTCIGTMDDKEILTNVTALAILVTTVIVNDCIQIIQVRHFLADRKFFLEEVVASVFVLLLTVMMAASAVMVLATKKYLHDRYKIMASDEQILESMEEGNLMFDKLKLMVQKYGVMAETSSPQFVMARSTTSIASSVVCLLAALVLVQAEIRLPTICKQIFKTASEYGWSVKWIVLSQTIGVVVGSIAPALRFFIAVRFKCCQNGTRGLKDEFKVNPYWTQKLMEWKECSLPMQIRNRKWRKILHNSKGLILSFLVRVQILIVLSSKGVQCISIGIMRPIFSCFHYIIKRLKNTFDNGPVRVHDVSESALNTGLDLSRYVLLLEGEAELPQQIQISISNEVDMLIETGKKQQPKNLISLLQKAGNFQGLRELEKNQVPSLHSGEPPVCWSLPLVTLTSIAVALPNIPMQEINWLLRSVDEGLFYVKLIEKAMDNKRNLVNSVNAADISWVGVELHLKWLDNDLHKTSLKGRIPKETLQDLSDKAEKTIMEFKTGTKDFMIENPLNWPCRVIAANSMHEICQRLLQAYVHDCPKINEELFQQICNMIANIMAACLANSANAIIMKFHHKGITDKEKCVHQAALLLGETEEILQILRLHRETISDPDESIYIEKWRNLLKGNL